jgi:hypothetical protein
MEIAARLDPKVGHRLPERERCAEDGRQQARRLPARMLLQRQQQQGHFDEILPAAIHESVMPQQSRTTAARPHQLWQTTKPSSKSA